jgi:hypothetical protein
MDEEKDTMDINFFGLGMGPVEMKISLLCRRNKRRD